MAIAVERYRGSSIATAVARGVISNSPIPSEMFMSMRKMQEILLKLKRWIFILPAIGNRSPDDILISLHTWHG